MGNQRDLKAFVRYDGSGRVVAGSLIFRKKKPTVGKFKQISSYQCCNFDQSPVVVNIGTQFPFTYPDFVLQAVGGTETYLYSYSDNSNAVANVDELAASLNAEFPVYGTFKAVDGDLILNPTAAIAELFAATGATSLQGFTFAD
jgi:hypothetical protein